MTALDTIRQFIADQTGITVIWMQSPTGVRPGKPFAALQVSSDERVGQGVVVDESWDSSLSDGQVHVISFHETVIQIYFFDDSADNDPRVAFERARSLRDVFDKPTVKERMRQDDFGFLGQEQLIDTTQLIDTKHESRAQLDIRFSTVKSQSDDLDFIKEVIINDETVQLTNNE